jgi:hypothetical protein
MTRRSIINKLLSKISMADSIPPIDQASIHSSFGGTTTEPEHKHGNSSIESGVEQGERHCSPATELATTPVPITQRSTGTKGDPITPLTDLGAGKHAFPHPQLQQVETFQSSPSHFPWRSTDVAVIPNASTDEAALLSPTRNVPSESFSGAETREDTLLTKATRAALDVDSKHNLAFAGPATK